MPHAACHTPHAARRTPHAARHELNGDPDPVMTELAERGVAVVHP
ncbi:hypothetical protein [Streptomyces avermitilis]